MSDHKSGTKFSKSKIALIVCGAVVLCAGILFAIKPAFIQNEVLRIESSVDASPSPSSSVSVSADEVVVTLHIKDNETKQLTEKKARLYKKLPIPTKDGYVFAGWWTKEEGGNIVNFANTVPKDNQDLYAHWVSEKESEESKVEVPILMYHQFYADPKDAIDTNYLDVKMFERQMQYLKDNHYYFPSWEEVSKFIDGKIVLPEKSVVVTDDDAAISFRNLAVPVIERIKIPVTSFMITTDYVEHFNSDYILERSHSNWMHVPGANGKGKMVNLPLADVEADLLKSVKLLNGVAQVFAYPFGHYNDIAEEALAKTGFIMAVTIEEGDVKRGVKKLELPRVRMSDGESWESFIDKVN
jgi:uncharacterized repeat protein (TIGR02543 family)